MCGQLDSVLWRLIVSNLMIYLLMKRRKEYSYCAHPNLLHPYHKKVTHVRTNTCMVYITPKRFGDPCLHNAIKSLMQAILNEQRHLTNKLKNSSCHDHHWRSRPWKIAEKGRPCRRLLFHVYTSVAYPFSTAKIAMQHADVVEDLSSYFPFFSCFWSKKAFWCFHFCLVPLRSQVHPYTCIINFNWNL